MYTTSYGLTQRPFENTPDPEFLFLSDLHREVLSSLIYGIQSAKGFILVSGDIGTGKTTLIHSLLREIGADNIILHIINPRISFNEILPYLAQKLGVKNTKQQDNLELIDTMRAKMVHLDKEEKRTILIIDEAHLLSEDSLEDLRLLSNIENEKKKLIQIVLVGQNEIHDVLQKDSQKPLKQRIILNRRLKPFNKIESIAYITHRLKVAGCNVQLFDKKALNKIWERSNGIPRLINQICDNALLIGYALKADIIGPGIIDEVIEDMDSGDRFHENKINTFLKKNKYVGATVAVAVIVMFMFIKTMSYQSPPTINAASLELAGATPHPTTEKIVAKVYALPVKEKDDISLEKPEIEIKGKKSSSGIDTPANIVQPGPAIEKTAPDIVTSESAIENPMEIPVGTREKEKKILPQNRVKIKQQILSKPRNEMDHIKNKPTNRETEVKPLEYLRSIARNEYGIGNTTIIDLIHMANPDIKHVNFIFPGQKIVLPDLEKVDLVVEDNAGTFHIHYASFYDFQSAKVVVQNLAEKDMLAFYVPVKQKDNMVYRIYIGVFNDRNEAVAYLDKVNFEYLSFL